MPGLRVLSYNIHKGFDATNLKYVLDQLKRSIEEVQADLVLLQEVLGQHAERSEPQFEYLADRLWPHFAYGKNAVHSSGHHGNAILSRYPIAFWENQDVSLNRWEKRGLLHAVLEVEGRSIHAMTTHLNLLEGGRRAQIDRLCERIEAMVPRDVPLIVGGDFNDWREKASVTLRSRLGLEEAFLVRHGSHARSFPSWLPALKLDRLYFRGVECESARLARDGAWTGLSDHLPIIAELRLPA